MESDWILKNKKVALFLGWSLKEIPHPYSVNKKAFSWVVPENDVLWSGAQGNNENNLFFSRSWNWLHCGWVAVYKKLYAAIEPNSNCNFLIVQVIERMKNAMVVCDITTGLTRAFEALIEGIDLLATKDLANDMDKFSTTFTQQSFEEVSTDLTKGL